jgi:nitric oxide synthase-interacting protein
VACATNGDLFCRECAINDLLAQRQEIKRLEREREEARKRLAEDEERALEDARRRELREFELVSMGLEAAKNDHAKGTAGGGGDNQRKRKAEETEEALAAFKAREIEIDGKRKKIFELDEKEMARIAREEQERLKRELKREKVLFAGSVLWCAFWLTGAVRVEQIRASLVLGPLAYAIDRSQ